MFKNLKEKHKEFIEEIQDCYSELIYKELEEYPEYKKLKHWVDFDFNDEAGANHFVGVLEDLEFVYIENIIERLENAAEEIAPILLEEAKLKKEEQKENK
jgi:hypothetical protein